EIRVVEPRRVRDEQRQSSRDAPGLCGSAPDDLLWVFLHLASPPLAAETRSPGRIELGVVAQDVAKCLKLFGLAIRSHAHHFVFVAESRKAQILCDCRVIQAERM